jgi:hypothetical protein
MDMGSITAAVGSLKAAGDIAKGLISLKTTTEVQAKAIELNEKIIDAQHQIFTVQATLAAALDQVRELQAELARAKDWEKQKERYRLAAPFAGCMVYALLKSHSEGETPHYVCAACFHQGRKSILQSRSGGPTGRRVAVYECPVCKSEAVSRFYNVVPPQYFEDIVPQ